MTNQLVWCLPCLLNAHNNNKKRKTIVFFFFTNKLCFILVVFYSTNICRAIVQALGASQESDAILYQFICHFSDGQQCYGNKAERRVGREDSGGEACCCRNGQGTALVRQENIEGTGNKECTCPKAGMCKGAREAEKGPKEVVGGERQS